MSSTSVPHFSFPLRLEGPAFAVTQQDTIDEVEDCVTVLLLTPQGSREELPAYGIPDPTFAQQPIAQQAILSEISKWEPRASMTLTQQPDAVSSMIARVAATVTR